MTSFAFQEAIQVKLYAVAGARKVESIWIAVYERLQRVSHKIFRQPGFNFLIIIRQ